MARVVPFALLLAAFSLTAADLTKLQIVVTNEAGKPVEQAEVIVKFVQGRSATKFGAKIRKSWEVRSSQEGMARIPAIPQGKILIQVNAKNYQTFGQTFDVQEEDKTIEVKLKPPQPQYTAHP
jgi:hypothetical protein